MRTIPTPQSCKGILLLTLCLAVVLFSAGCIQDQTIPVSEADKDRMNATFAAVYASVGHSLDAIGADVAGTAEDQSGRLSADPFLKLSVKELYQKYPWTEWAVRYDWNGTVLAGYPAYGNDTPYLRNAAITKSAFSDAGYLMSAPKINEKGKDLLSLSAPVYTPDGAYDGYVSLELDPWMYLQQVMRETEYPAYQIWLIDTAGVVYVSPDAVATGENILTSSIYGKTKGAEIVREIAEVPQGMAAGDGYDPAYTRLTSKLYRWDSLTTGGTEVCVILSVPVGTGTPVFPAKSNDILSMRQITTDIVMYEAANGQTKTLEMLNNPNGRFALDDGAAFAYDTNGTLLADATRGSLITENFLNYRDGYGVETIKMLIKRSNQGGRYVPYFHPVPGEHGESTALLCLAYVQPINETWFVGAIQPFSSVHVPYTIPKRDEALKNVQLAFSYLDEFGKDAALAAFMDPKGPFLQQGIRIYAIARDGMILADGKRPYNVGKNGFFFTDRYGGSMSRFAVMIGTTDNSGYMLSLHNADNGGIRVVLQYSRRAEGGDWMIGTTVELGTVATAA
ncbi:MAG: cache domain-containing protein [Methanocorpusculum sp.]|nr:cache domain-containing protein [Methanocorpusculum sp.]